VLFDHRILFNDRLFVSKKHWKKDLVFQFYEIYQNLTKTFETTSITKDLNFILVKSVLVKHGAWINIFFSISIWTL